MVDKVMILPIPTFTRIRQADNNADTLMLYMLYRYTMAEQMTREIICTATKAAKILGWTQERVCDAKSQLIELGLIEEGTDRYSDGRIARHTINLKVIPYDDYSD